MQAHIHTIHTCYTMHTIKRYDILYMCTLYHNILTHYINLYYAKQDLNIHLTIVAETTLLPKQVSVRCAIHVATVEKNMKDGILCY